MPKIVPNLIAQPVSRGRGAPQWGAPQISGGDPSGIAREIQQTGQQIGATSDAVAQWQAMRDETEFIKYQTKVGELTNKHFEKISALGFEDLRDQRGSLDSQYEQSISNLREEMGIYSTRADLFDLKTIAEATQKESAYYITKETEYRVAVGEEWLANTSAKMGTFATKQEAYVYWESELPAIQHNIELLFPGDTAAQQRAMDKVMAAGFTEMIYGLVNNKNFDDAASLLKVDITDDQGLVEAGGLSAYQRQFTNGREMLDAKALGALREFVNKAGSDDAVATVVMGIAQRIRPSGGGTPTITESEALDEIMGSGLSSAQKFEAMTKVQQVFTDAYQEKARNEKEFIDSLSNTIWTGLHNEEITTNAQLEAIPGFSKLPPERIHQFYAYLKNSAGGTVKTNISPEDYNDVLYHYTNYVKKNKNVSSAVLGVYTYKGYSVTDFKKEDMEKLQKWAIDNEENRNPMDFMIKAVASKYNLDAAQTEKLEYAYITYLSSTDIDENNPVQQKQIEEMLGEWGKLAEKDKLDMGLVFSQASARNQRVAATTMNKVGVANALGVPVYATVGQDAVVEAVRNNLHGEGVFDFYAKELGWIRPKFSAIETGMTHMIGYTDDANAAGRGNMIDPNLLIAVAEVINKDENIQAVIAQGRAGPLGLKGNVEYNDHQFNAKNSDAAFFILSLSLRDELPMDMPDGTVRNPTGTMSSSLRAFFMDQYGLSEEQAQAALERVTGVYGTMRSHNPYTLESFDELSTQYINRRSEDF